MTQFDTTVVSSYFRDQIYNERHGFFAHHNITLISCHFHFRCTNECKNFHLTLRRRNLNYIDYNRHANANELHMVICIHLYGGHHKLQNSNINNPQQTSSQSFEGVCVCVVSVLSLLCGCNLVILL